MILQANAAERINSFRYRRLRRFLASQPFLCALIAGAVISSGCRGGGAEALAEPASRTEAASTGNIFVSPDGSDANDGRGPERPLQTINAAVQVAGPGDQVVITPGRYRELVLINRSGEPDRPIVFTSLPGQPAIIDGGLIPGERAVVIDGEWIVLRGVIIENSGDKGLLVFEGNNVVIDSVVSRFNDGVGIELFEGENNRVIRSTSHDNFDHPGEGENADGFGISGSGHILQGCVAFNNSDDGFDAWQSTGVTIERSIAYRNGFGPEGDGNGFKLSNFSDGNTTARKNIAYENSRRGFTNNGGGNHHFINNTAWNNRINFQSTGPVPNVFANNLSIAGELDLNEAAQQNNNSWNLEIHDPGPIVTDPNSPDFLTPQSGSTVIDSGTATELEFQGAAPDIGALEQGERIADLPAEAGARRRQ